MCRYCKKLNEVMDLERKQLTDCINRWKRRDRKARCIISQLICALQFEYKFRDVLALIDEASDFVHCDWIGK